MIDISAKSNTLRRAVAEAAVSCEASTVQRVREGTVPKGDPLPIAKAAAVLAVKRTSDTIPYCHPVPVDHVEVEFTIEETLITAKVSVTAVAKTGMEMEAMHGAATAALTVYDMLKMLDESMEITGVRLLEKSGGKSDFRERYTEKLRAAVLVMSDSVASGRKQDTSGRMIQARLEQHGVHVEDYRVIPDEQAAIEDVLRYYADEMTVDLVLTTGGTGFSPRDCTPEAMLSVIEREIPGIPEALRTYGQNRTPYSMLSRGKAGIRNNTIIVNLPGSRKGVAESLDALFPGVLHSFKMLWMQGSWSTEHTNGGPS
ncbi:MAG: bifunctional molybdenum cofactor biosynthesis protein MoaC/MoaB [Ectothiorhodospiraceae bacterium]|nr:bifunctional molybdenum cofactor biosynthesis protein MoaC/MoaB [Ectothiorhodospiraceae bacterium]